MNGPYDDIIRLPHHVSATRAPMPAGDRAAQFSPFAALTGLEAAMSDTARQAQEQMEPVSGAADHTQAPDWAE